MLRKVFLEFLCHCLSANYDFTYTIATSLDWCCFIEARELLSRLDNHVKVIKLARLPPRASYREQLMSHLEILKALNIRNACPAVSLGHEPVSLLNHLELGFAHIAL